MRYLKVWGLAVLGAVVMTCFGATSALATELDGPGGALPSGTVIHFDLEEYLSMHPPIGTIECEISTISAKTTNAGSSTETVKAAVESLSLEACNSAFTVLKKGALEIHTDTADGSGVSGNGTVTWSGLELTTSFLGFHCIFSTNSTDLGTIVGSTSGGGRSAELKLTATIPRTGGNSGAFCGSTAQWTGTYSITSPSVLDVT